MAHNLSHTTTGVLVIDKDGIILSSNEAMLSLLDYASDDDLLTQSIDKFFTLSKTKAKATAKNKNTLAGKLKHLNPTDTISAYGIKKGGALLPTEIISVKLCAEEEEFSVCTVKSTLAEGIEHELADFIQKITLFAFQCNDDEDISPYICQELGKRLELESAWIAIKNETRDLEIKGVAGKTSKDIALGKILENGTLSKTHPNLYFALRHGQTHTKTISETAEILSIPLVFCKEAIGIMEIKTKKSHLIPEIRERIDFLAERLALILKMAIDQHHLELLSTAISSAANGVFITDTDGKIIWTNKAFSLMTGYKESELLKHNLHILKSGKQSDAFLDELWNTIKSGKKWSGEVVNRDKFGALYTVQQTISPMIGFDGEISHYVVTHDDLTAKKDAEGLLNIMTNYDPMTRLPNRAMFEKLLSEKIESLKTTKNKKKVKIAVFFIDISNFNIINDTIGHSAGDKILRDVADSLSYMTSSGDLLSRFGGDNFVLATEVKDADETLSIASKILACISEPKDLDGREINLSSYIGIATYPDDTDDSAKLLNYADMAMHKAALVGANTFFFFSRQINEETESRMTLERDLRKALVNHEFILNYQPQIDLRTGEVSGWEALIRWHHPVLGLVPPVSFIPIAEDSGLILPIGEWVLIEALRQWRRWREMGLPNSTMAVNLSAIQFRQADLASFVEKSLVETGVTPENLELELTESVVMQNAEMANEALKKISDIGVKIAIDDFGTGYSSLSYLRRFPVDKLKIDRSFIMELEKDKDYARITDAIIKLGHVLGMEVIAEGVETKAQLQSLKGNGCDAIQGYLLGKPLNSDEVPKYIKEKQYLLAK